MKKTKLALTLTSSAILAAQALPQVQQAMPAAELAAMNKAELKTQLAAKDQSSNAQAEAEAELFAGCYSPFEVTPQQTEYVCPICGERTTRVKQGYVPAGSREVVVPDIEECRRLFARLPVTAGYKLDESEYCAKCSPRVKNPSPTLLVTTTKGHVRRVRHVTTEDLRLLSDYFAASDSNQAAMSKDSRRLQHLLGK